MRTAFRKVGGEFRQFFNNNFRDGIGAFAFPSVTAFLADTANSFSVTLDNQSSSIVQGAPVLIKGKPNTKRHYIGTLTRVNVTLDRNQTIGELPR